MFINKYDTTVYNFKTFFIQSHNIICFCIINESILTLCINPTFDQCCRFVNGAYRMRCFIPNSSWYILVASNSSFPRVKLASVSRLIGGGRLALAQHRWLFNCMHDFVYQYYRYILRQNCRNPVHSLMIHDFRKGANHVRSGVICLCRLRRVCSKESYLYNTV